MDDATESAGRAARRRVRFCVAVLLFCLVVPAAMADGAYPFVTAWGSRGTGPGQFNYSWGIGSDSAGAIYVADFYNDRIQKFSSNGTFLTAWGGYGTGEGKLRHPTGVAVDAAGNVYVADHYNHRVQKFSSGGTFIAAWGGPGTEPGKMSFPYGVAVDGDGDVYVADYYNHRVQKFSPNGTFLAAWGSRGTNTTQFTYPCGVAVDRNGTIYVADQYNHRVQVLDPHGAYIATMGGDGNGTAQMHYPTHIAFDAAGDVYVCDHGNHRIQKYTSSRALVATWGTRGSGPGQFESPTGLALDGAGNVYVADTNNNRVQKFAGPGPYRPVTLPGAIEAEEFDLGGEGVAYHDTTPGNGGGAACRTAEDVEIVALAGGGYAVGGIRDGEWLAYTIGGVTDPGAGYPYPVELSVASDRDGRSIEIEVDGTAVRTVGVPNTGSPTNFTPVLTQFSLTAGGLPEQGRHTVRLRFHGDGQGLDRVVFLDRHPAMYADGWAWPKFTANRTNGTAPLAVRFIDESSKHAYGWHWWFGDDGPLSSSTEQNPVHTFGEPGNYTVSLTIDEEDYWFVVGGGPGGVPVLGWYHHLWDSQIATMQITVTAPVVPVPPGALPPLDGDGDGLYDDVNGNGRADFADVVLYFSQMSWIAGNEPVPAFDFNGNGRIDFADVVWLFNRL